MQERTAERKRFQLYDKPGRHTFFIPVDSAFNVSYRDVIRKHDIVIM